MSYPRALRRAQRRAAAIAATSLAVVLTATGLQAFTAPATSSPAAQSAAGDDYWTSTNEQQRGAKGGNDARVQPRAYEAYTLDRPAIAQRLEQAPAEDASADPVVVRVPAPTGELVEFAVTESPVMQDGLAAAHPELRTYAGRGVEDPTASIRLDLTRTGFHASVRGAGEKAAWYVDPAYNGDQSLYVSYRGSDVPAPQRGLVEPELDHDLHQDLTQQQAAGEAPGTAVSLRTYRLALLNDPSYATYFGTANVLSEKVTLMNRVNHIYNDDLAIRMLLIDESDALNLDTAAEATEPNGPCGAAACFTPAQLTSCGSSTLSRNRIVLGQLVGASSFDVGHVALGVNGGGIAGLAVVGGDRKAAGCTGLPTPEGDFFAIDYVAHELGHQFGGPHTFNGTEYNCGGNRNGSPWEPGSGTSVMAYAGICQQDNLQPHTDPYFSQRSVTDLTTYVLTPRPAINEVQTVSLRGFDTDGESIILTFNGQTTAPIVRGTTWTTAAIDAAIEAVTGAGTVTVAAFGGSGDLTDAGFQVTFNGPGLAGVNQPQLSVAVASGDASGFVGETAKGGPIDNAGWQVTTTANRAPVATAPADRTIPIRTPFTLTGSATDPDGDALVHIWEQNDRGGATGVRLGSQAKADGPLFRIFGAYAPVTPAGTLEIESPGENIADGNPSRTFPDMAQIAANNTNVSGECPPMPAPPATGGASNVPVPVVECFAEWLPTAAYVGSAAAGNTEPSLNFRFTARDLDPEAGGYAYDDVKLTLDKAAGPFLVNSKNTPGAAVAGRTETVTWTVAGTNAPTMAPDVRISLSTDGGLTFPTVLVESTPNDGSAPVTWPNNGTTQARIKIEAVGNYFFDINNADFSIRPSLSVDGPGATTTTAAYGQGVSPAVELSATTGAVDADSISATASGLPTGLTLDRVEATADGVRPATARWAVRGKVTAAAGTYPVTVTISDGSNDPVERTFTVVVTGGPGDTTAPSTSIGSGPADGSVLLKRTARFGLVSSESPATFRCTLDGAPIACGDTLKVKKPSAGTHVVSVAAVDAAGNVDATPVTRTFTVPLDDGALKSRGAWKRVASAKAFGGDYARSRQQGATLSHRLRRATSVSLVVSTGRTSGPVEVFVGRDLVKTFALRGKGRTKQLRTVDLDGATSGNLRIVVAEDKQVRIEGVAITTTR
ncbi:M12 family metallo-peptidase [Nocardioides renjunii]|uniref:M12 family metallo-peptidase n=1 Tax=Nocardioides renjunii TaxID=3095075 RepID=UPI002AFEB21C|nr:M12 family metallo-peptidase [Nocardioides sp. S-34]WQQ21775.1 M12 family metallo-peptidase [Nocardioides sp. S-34]